MTREERIAALTIITSSLINAECQQGWEIDNDSAREKISMAEYILQEIESRID